jgi:hypothetical protein
MESKAGLLSQSCSVKDGFGLRDRRRSYLHILLIFEVKENAVLLCLRSKRMQCHS